MSTMLDSPGGTTPTLQSEIFVQSDRMAAFVLMGILRWGMFALLGLIFPFLIVSTATYTWTHLRAAARQHGSFWRLQDSFLIERSHKSPRCFLPRMPWTPTASCSSPACACWAAWSPSSSCPRPKERPWWRSLRSSGPSACAGFPSQSSRTKRAPSYKGGCRHRLLFDQEDKEWRRFLSLLSAKLFINGCCFFVCFRIYRNLLESVSYLQ